MLDTYISNNDVNDIDDSAKCIISITIEENQTTNKVAKRIEQLLHDSNIYKKFTDFVQQQTDNP